MELVRAILLVLEATPEDQFFPTSLQIPGHSEIAVGYHIHLMGEAGLLMTANTSSMDDTRSQAVPRGITWAGHDFIDTMRSQEVWERTKQAMREAGGGGFGLMLDLGKKVAEGFIRTKLKEATGIDFT